MCRGAGAAESMRILMLGSSGELIGGDDPRGTTLDRVCAAVADRTGGAVEGQFAYASPTTTLTNHIARVMDRIEPDVVILQCSVDLDLSLDLGLRRRFGGTMPCPIDLGRGLARRATGYDIQAGFHRQRGRRAALYGAMRDALLVAGLGATAGSVSQTIAVYDDAIRLIVAREPLLLVCGPAWVGAPLPNRRLQRQAVERVTAVSDGIEQICRRRRVPFCSVLARIAADPARYVGPDPAHRSMESVALRADAILETLLPLLSR